jgi:hypothetical protein
MASAPGAGENAATLPIARAATPEPEAFIGNQVGPRGRHSGLDPGSIFRSDAE